MEEIEPNLDELKISVIIPNYNGETFIDELVACLVKQSFDSRLFEVIIVDNGSNDRSIEMLQAYERDHSFLKVFVYTELQSSYAARNFGVSKSSAPVLVFTDIDCRPREDWLEKIFSEVEELAGEYLIVGAVELYPIGDEFNPCEWFDKCTSLRQDYYSKTRTGTTANLTVSRFTLDAVEGFAPVISGGDRDFCRRVGTRDIYFKFNPAICVDHPTRSTVAEINKKIRRLTEGAAIRFYNSSGILGRILHVVKNIIGIVVHLHYWKVILETARERGIFTMWFWRFCFLTLYFGGYARCMFLQKFWNCYRNPAMSSCSTKESSEK